jgi:hypothetical protein
LVLLVGILQQSGPPVICYHALSPELAGNYFKRST